MCVAVDNLLEVLEHTASRADILKSRPDADQVHNDGFYFFDIKTHRVLVLVELGEDAEARIVWVGDHADYELTFKNNSAAITKWLRNKDLI